MIRSHHTSIQLFYNAALSFRNKTWLKSYASFSSINWTFEEIQVLFVFMKIVQLNIFAVWLCYLQLVLQKLQYRYQKRLVIIEDIVKSWNCNSFWPFEGRVNKFTTCFRLTTVIDIYSSQLLSWYGELDSRQLLIYTFFSYWAKLSFTWSQDSGHGPIFTLF